MKLRQRKKREKREARRVDEAAKGFLSRWGRPGGLFQRGDGETPILFGRPSSSATVADGARFFINGREVSAEGGTNGRT